MPFENEHIKVMLSNFNQQNTTMKIADTNIIINAIDAKNSTETNNATDNKKIIEKSKSVISNPSGIRTVEIQQTRFAQLAQCKKLMLLSRSPTSRKKNITNKKIKNPNENCLSMQEGKDFFNKLMKSFDMSQKERQKNYSTLQELIITGIGSCSNKPMRPLSQQTNRNYASLSNLRHGKITQKLVRQNTSRNFPFEKNKSVNENCFMTLGEVNRGLNNYYYNKANEITNKITMIKELECSGLLKSKKIKLFKSASKSCIKHESRNLMPFNIKNSDIRPDTALSTHYSTSSRQFIQNNFKTYQ